MKLIFNKTEQGDIQVQMQNGTTLIDFDYVELLKNLIEDCTIEPEWNNLLDEETEKLQEMINKIIVAVQQGMNVKQ